MGRGRGPAPGWVPLPSHSAPSTHTPPLPPPEGPEAPVTFRTCPRWLSLAHLPRPPGGQRSLWGRTGFLRNTGVLQPRPTSTRQRCPLPGRRGSHVPEGGRAMLTETPPSSIHILNPERTRDPAAKRSARGHSGQAAVLGFEPRPQILTPGLVPCPGPPPLRSSPLGRRALCVVLSSHARPGTTQGW